MGLKEQNFQLATFLLPACNLKLLHIKITMENYSCLRPDAVIHARYYVETGEP